MEVDHIVLDRVKDQIIQSMRRSRYTREVVVAVHVVKEALGPRAFVADGLLCGMCAGY